MAKTNSLTAAGSVTLLFWQAAVTLIVEFEELLVAFGKTRLRYEEQVRPALSLKAAKNVGKYQSWKVE